MTDFQKIDEIAAKWVVMEDRGLTIEERRSLDDWLEQSNAHRIAYLRLNSLWTDADRLAMLKRGDAPEDSKRKWKVPFKIPGYSAPAAAALVAIIIIPSSIPKHGASNRAHIDRIVTGVGQSRTIKLADGTHVELNTNTRVQVAMTSSYRAITLEQGEVYLDVAHDPKRPFVVLAGNRKITDIGTKFSVYRNHDQIQVVVQSGRVRVDTVNSSAVELPVFANGGNVITATGDETLVVTEHSQDIAKDLDWRNGMLVFNRETLADAASEFNRYNAKQIVVEGEARDIRIGGSFRAQNVDAFASLAQESFGLRVDRRGNEIHISK